MSGGSFEYLCFKTETDLLGGSHDEHLQAIAGTIRELGGAAAADATDALIQDLIMFRTSIRSQAQRLERVWHAVEWYVSCDYTREQALSAIADFAAGAEPTKPSVDLAQAYSGKTCDDCGYVGCSPKDQNRRCVGASELGGGNTCNRCERERERTRTKE